MPSVSNALIVGGSTSGLSCAIALRRAGVDAHVVEIKDEWKVLGSGVTIMGATLRALAELGLADECVARGAGGTSVGIYDADGTALEIVPVPQIAGPQYPSVAGVMRQPLHDMLLEAARAEDTPMRLGTTVEALVQEHDGVVAELSGGQRERYDLVVGADGLHSEVRRLVFGDRFTPHYTGQIVWRAVVPRPPDYTELAMFYGPTNKAGINAVSATSAYLFLAENNPSTERPPRATWPTRLRELLAEFGGPVARIREQISDPATIDCRPLQGLLVPPPWHVGRVVLIGDAVHASTPQLAMGAGLAIEDSIVLAQLLAGDLPVDTALERFVERRFDRCRMVVENSIQLGTWEQHPDDPEVDPGGLSQRSWAALAEPI